ncbi:MAG: family acetyltransferase [Geminicoccaceae bacterium]|nr:family acetyltransferase [Geminicoccaceae bacterium]MDF2781036.1 family acetyltransferase [Geminicoccaceae bacterium]
MSNVLSIAVERAERADVRALLLTVRSWAEDLYSPASRHGLDMAAYEHPEVTLLVAREAGTVVGCGAWRLQSDGSAEVKSMFVLPEARGRGIGRAILAAIEDALRGRVTMLRLETGIKQEPAIRLYESAGFRRRGPFGSYRDDPLSIFMEKAL